MGRYSLLLVASSRVQYCSVSCGLPRIRPRAVAGRRSSLLMPTYAHHQSLSVDYSQQRLDRRRLKAPGASPALHLKTDPLAHRWPVSAAAPISRPAVGGNRRTSGRTRASLIWACRRPLLEAVLEALYVGLQSGFLRGIRGLEFGGYPFGTTKFAVTSA